jgi:hypothetical protein
MIVRGTRDIIKELMKIDNLLNKQFKEIKHRVSPKDWDNFCQQVFLTYFHIKKHPQS